MGDAECRRSDGSEDGELLVAIAILSRFALAALAVTERTGYLFAGRRDRAATGPEWPAAQDQTDR